MITYDSSPKMFSRNTLKTLLLVEIVEAVTSIYHFHYHMKIPESELLIFPVTL